LPFTRYSGSIKNSLNHNPQIVNRFEDFFR
jgi:hypothetical protein